MRAQLSLPPPSPTPCWQGAETSSVLAFWAMLRVTRNKGLSTSLQSQVERQVFFSWLYPFFSIQIGICKFSTFPEMSYQAVFYLPLARFQMHSSHKKREGLKNVLSKRVPEFGLHLAQLFLTARICAKQIQSPHQNFWLALGEGAVPSPFVLGAPTWMAWRMVLLVTQEFLVGTDECCSRLRELSRKPGT